MPVQDFSPPLQDFGTLRLQVTTAQGAFPVPNAVIEVLSPLPHSALLYRGHTDASGIADDLPLPANPRADSQRPETAPASPQRYTVIISHSSFLPQTHPVSLFAGVKTILPVVLVPVLPTERRLQ